jgi:phosphatidylserine/phosphatidylglycerophosphate/cardiolipin synthase-like enzyme
VQSVPEETDLAVPGLAFAQDEWIKKIDASQQTIDIEQMYMDGEPGHAIDPVIEALTRAAARGVKIRLILSQQMIKTSQPTLDILLSRIPNLEYRVIHLGPITGGIQHAKFFIFDQSSVFVGSQNFDWKALTQILETGVTIDDIEIAAQLKSIFDLDWEIARTGKLPADLGIAPARAESADVRLVACPPRLNPRNIKSAFEELTALL